MLVILAKWILKFERFLEDLLRPLRLILPAENPALHVLCFHDKDAETGYKYVINLRGAVWRWQRDIVYPVVRVLWKPQLSSQFDQGFAKHTFEPRRLEKGNEKQDGDNPPQLEHFIDDWRVIHR